MLLYGVSTHSRPKAAGVQVVDTAKVFKFQHTAARRRLVVLYQSVVNLNLFQHTAARRRLEESPTEHDFLAFVSTHSRPKAAG